MYICWVQLSLLKDRIEYNQVSERSHGNSKTLKKENKDTNRWKDSPCSWNRRIDILKVDILLMANYRFNINPIKISMAFFTETEKQP